MKEFDKYVDGELTPNEEEQVLKQLFKLKKEQDLKKDWTQKLMQNEGVGRDAKYAKRVALKQKKRTSRILLSIAATLILLVAFIFLLPRNASNSNMLVDQYLQNDPFPNASGFRGAENKDEQRAAAAYAYNTKEFSKAASAYESLLAEPEVQESDYLYLGLSHLYTNNYQEAASTLNQGMNLSRSLDDAQFTQELRWFLALSLLKNDQTTEAINQLNLIQMGEWNYAKAQSLLESIQ